MKKNLSTVDRGVRLAAGLLIVVLYFTGVFGGWTAAILGLVALILIVTSFVSFCPAYALFGLTTRKETS